MLTRIARSADRLAVRLPDTDLDKATWRARVARLGGECGCAAGGASLVGAVVVAVVHALRAGDPGFALLVASVAFVFAASLVGKLAGVTVAAIRLLKLRRRIASRLLTTANDVRTDLAASEV
jgi:hypothetical protein